MKYPTKKEIYASSHEECCRWWRFLPIAKNLEEVELIELLKERLDYFGGFTPEISKKIGWRLKI